MHESHPCPQCGELLEVPAAMHGQPVRCGTCSRVFTPREPVLAADFDEPLERPRRRRRSRIDESDGSSRRTILIILGVVGIIGLLCCTGFGFLIYKMMNPKWQPYDSPEGQFTANFPGSVQSSSFVTGRIRKNGSGETANGVASFRSMIQEEFFVYYVPLTDAELLKPQKLFDEFADGLMAQSPGCTEERPRFSHMVGGYDAMDIVLEVDDDRFTQARIILANGKAYVVGVTGPGQPDGSPWVQEFIDSFQPKDAAKPRNGKNPFRK